MKNSFLTVTDQFCGAGGSSLGAVAAGVELVMGLNHWKLAIETHATNFPDAAHDCADMSAVNPRRYPATDILITSPECTNHSLAKGKKRKTPQLSMFGKAQIDPSEERSRATMWDVPRFAEIHRYNLIIVENVVDARKWELWPSWLHAMDLLGYDYKIVYFNSMFAHPTPQSRDRMYVVFWRKGNKAPDLDFRPRAYCPKCERDIEAVQSWKNPELRWGRYRRQYLYLCPTCARVVEPYYYCAANAIDWSIPAPRIGDRKKPLKEKTYARIQAGLEKFARPYLFDTVHTARGNRHQDMVWPADGPGRTQLGNATHGMVVPPFLIETMFSHAGDDRISNLEEALTTQTTRQTAALAIPPFIVDFAHTLSDSDYARSAFEALVTQTTAQSLGALIPPFVVNMQGECGATSLTDPLPTQLGTNHRWLCFLSSYYGTNEGAPLTDALPTVPTVDKHALVTVPFTVSLNHDTDRNRLVTEEMATVMPYVSPALTVPPFILGYYTRDYGDGAALTRMDEAIPTQSTRPLHYLVNLGQTPSVEDCGFRMLQPHEIQKAMAFPGEYKILGTQREKVKQLGNAVTPPVMEMLMARCVESLS